jgi:hypothetical protein
MVGAGVRGIEGYCETLTVPLDVCIRPSYRLTCRTAMPMVFVR